MVALINADVKTLECDDSTHTPGEKLGDYEEEWNSILSGEDGNASPADLQEVLEREGALGERPVELYTKPPFSTISRLMMKEGLSTTDVQVFLRWKAKDDNMKAARAAKGKRRKGAKKAHSVVKTNWFLERKKKQSLGNF